jgi:S1-C subfamily serine protease
MLLLLALSAAPSSPVPACPRVLNGTERAGAATAVCVGHKDGYAYLLSAAHALPAGQAQTFQFFPAGDAPDRKPARELVGGEVLLRLPDPDLVLVRVPVGGEPAPELPLVARGRKPRAFPAAARAVGCPDGRPPEVRDEVVVGRVPVWAAAGDGQPRRLRGFFWACQRPPVGGMSGGPLLDRDGAVIGVCSAAGRGDGRGYYTYADEILAALAVTEHRWLVR